MDRPRLKNYFILLLLLVNAVFAGVYVLNLLEETAIKLAEEDALRGAFERAGIRLEAELPFNASYRSGVLAVSKDAERALAERALGAFTYEERGGGITYYSGEKGNASFEHSGGFEINLTLPQSSEPPEPRAEQIAKNLGLKISEPSPDEAGTLNCVILRRGMKVFNQSLTFEFGGDGVRIRGSYLPGSELDAPDTFDAPTAVIGFLHKIEIEGVLCSEVTSVEAGYRIVSGEYVPAWQVETDAGVFVLESQG